MPSSHDRSRLLFGLRYAARHPDRILPHLKRGVRDLRLGLGTHDHIAYYRSIMSSDVAHGADRAVGSPSRDSWLATGRLQFDYLLTHGLEPEMRMLEIGCGNLRAGHLFIDHLGTGNYHGIDISPPILLAALRTVADFGLQAKAPRLTLVDDLTLNFLPDDAFDVVHAHSVFSHSPIDVIEQCLANVGRVMAPGAFFDFTFDHTTGVEHDVLREDFYYRSETLTSLAARYGLLAALLDDWAPLHPQSKLRATRVHPRPHPDEAVHAHAG